MSALRHFTDYQAMAGRPFAPKKNRARKLSSRCQPQSANTKPGRAAAADDLALIMRAIAGESEAQARLFELHTPRLYRAALHVLRNKEDAEDAVQDTWRRAYSRLHTFERRSSISTWLTRIAINSVLMIRRRNKRLSEVSLHREPGDEGFLPQPVAHEPTPEESCGYAEMRHLLERQIGRLPSLNRTALLLRDIDGLTTRESTKLLRINNSALKSRLQRARRSLAQSLRPLLSIDRQRDSRASGRSELDAVAAKS